jgi:glutamate-1-semialdehyde 2,1-aminomutase
MQGGYHGQYDYLIGGELSRLGLPNRVDDDLVEGDFNDLRGCRELLEQHADSLCAVIVEPMMTIPGAVHQRDNFISELRVAALEHDVPFILDEVVTGLRFGLSGATGHYRVSPPPDMVVMGKMLGGGLPVAAVLGRADLLDAKVSASNTHAQNDACMAASLAMISQLNVEHYRRLHAQGERLRDGLRQLAKDLSIPLAVTGDGPCAGLHFTSEEVVDYASARRGDQRRWRLMCLGMARAGFSLSSRTFGVTMPFTDADVEDCLVAFDHTLRAIGTTSEHDRYLEA